MKQWKLKTFWNVREEAFLKSTTLKIQKWSSLIQLYRFHFCEAHDAKLTDYSLSKRKKDQSLSLGYCDHYMLILHLKVYPKRSFSGKLFFFHWIVKKDINRCSSKSDALLWQILLLKLILMLKNIERNHWIRYCVWGVWWELFSDLTDLTDWHCLISNFKEVGDSEHLKPALSSILYY